MHRSVPTTLGRALLLLQCFLFAYVQATTRHLKGSDSGAASELASKSTSGSASEEENEDTPTHILSSTKHLQVAPSIAAAILGVAGAGICMAGYKLFRPTTFVCAFLVGGYFLASIAETAFKNTEYQTIVSWITFAAAGMICGFTVLFLYNLGIFLAGAAAGALLALTLNTQLGPQIWPDQPDAMAVILCVVLGIIGGVLALKLERPVLIVCTAFVGAALFVIAVGHFSGNFPNGTDLKQYAKQLDDGHYDYHLPDAWYGYLGGLLVLFVLGMLVQFTRTAPAEQVHRRH